jgi:hypothetical protein
VIDEFLTRFRRMVDELETHPHLEVIDFHFSRPAKPEEIADAARAVGGGLPDGVEAFYREMNGFTLEWEITLEELRQGDDSDKGLIDLLPLEEVLKDWQGSIWQADDERFKPVKPLDFFVPEACSALLYREGSGFAPTVHYHYLGELLLDTGYGFRGYIDRLLASRGAWYWIETLCRETHGSPPAQAFFRRMPKLFPGFDPSLFQPGEGALTGP